MTRNFFKVSFTLAGVALFAALPVNAADSIGGMIIVENVCQTCHGLDGVATVPNAANLSGQQEMYMKIQLERYRSGERGDPQMNIIAKTLSDKDIDDVSAYYAGIKITVEMPQ